MKRCLDWMIPEIHKCYVLGLSYTMTCGYLLQFCAEHQLPTEEQYNHIINVFNFN